jgi:hypothetical protein
MNTEPHHIAPKQQLESDCSARSQVPAFNDYTVFLVLEEERAKTKLACDAKCSVNTESIRDQKETTLNLPPRYQHLDLSAEWFISRLESPVQEPEDSAQIWKQLDTFSYLILRDLTKVLKKKHDQLRKPANIFQALVSTVGLQDTRRIICCTFHALMPPFVRYGKLKVRRHPMPLEA